MADEAMPLFGLVGTPQLCCTIVTSSKGGAFLFRTQIAQILTDLVASRIFKSHRKHR